MTNFPDKLQPFIIPEKLTPVDCVELLLMASEALRQCQKDGHSEMGISHSMDAAEVLQEEFTGIWMHDDFLLAKLTPNEWAQLAQFAAEQFNKLSG
jgi:hypothetical protein